MSIIGNIGGQSGGSSLTKSILIVTAPTGSTVTVTKDSTTKTATEKNGEWWFKNLENGEWTIRATLDGQNATETYNISQFGVYRKAISYKMTPEFTYTGDYEIVQDDDTPIADFASWKGNWKIRFLTSGDFTITNMHEFAGRIDVFLVGAGASGSSRKSASGNYGAGAGSGYTKTSLNINVEVGARYEVVVGAGGSPVSGNPAYGKLGGDTSIFNEIASGGKGLTGTSDKTVTFGGDGGSGGAGKNGNPGIDGADGTGINPGHGQNTTTREFGEQAGRLYAEGGKFGQTLPAAAIDNTGNGGDGAIGDLSGPGSSGIVIIRNAREVAQ